MRRNFLKIFLIIILFSLLLPVSVQATDKIKEFAIAVRDEDGDRKKQGDIIAWKPYLWVWGVEERKRYLIVYVSGVTDEQANKLCQNGVDNIIAASNKRRYAIKVDWLKANALPALDTKKLIDKTIVYQPYKDDPSLDAVDSLFSPFYEKDSGDNVSEPKEMTINHVALFMDKVGGWFKPETLYCATPSRIMPLDYNTSDYGSTCDGSCDYTDLGTWEAATDIDMVTATKGEVLQCYDDSDGYDDTIVAASTAGFTDSSYFRVIMCYPGEGHGTDGSTGVRFDRFGTNIGFYIQEDYFCLYDTIHYLDFNGGANHLHEVVVSGDNCRIAGVMVQKAYNARSGHGATGFYIIGTGNYIINCIGVLCEWHSFKNGAGTNYFYNCTANSIYSGSYNFERVGGTANATNCIAQTGTYFFGGAWNLTTCLSNQGVTYVDPGSFDYSLADVSTMAIGQGTDLSGMFDDDFGNVTRTGSWDIGARDYVSPVSPQVIISVGKIKNGYVFSLIL